MGKYFYLCIIILNLIFTVELYAKTSSDTNSVSYTKLGIISGISVGGIIIGELNQKQTYWNERTSFHVMDFKTEYNDALLADKYGHLFFAYAVSRTYSTAFEWSGFNRKNATLLGGAVAFLYQTYIEIQDGFSTGAPYLGFSVGDMLANTTGAIFPYLQLQAPVLQNFNFKISFQKSANYEKIGYNSITEDYESTFHWLSINVNGLLSENAKKWYPAFINFAIGHSVKNIDRYGAGNHELYLAFDWNLEALPGDSFILKLLKQTFNLYKLPAPAVKIYPNVVWYGLKL